MATDDKPKPDISPGVNALTTFRLLLRDSRPVVYPALIRFVFPCKQCDKAFAIEEGFRVRTALSVEDVQRMLMEFAKTVEPRTVTCSCGLKTEYHQEDVRAYPLESG
jgi:hypothetical protein